MSVFRIQKGHLTQLVDLISAPYMTLIFLVVATTHQAYTLPFNTHQPPIACAAVAETGPIMPHRGLKFPIPLTIGGDRFSANTGSRHRKLAPIPNICTHRAGEIGLLSPGVGSGLSSSFGGPKYLRPGCPHSIGKRESATADIPDRILLVQPYVLILPLYSGCRLFPQSFWHRG